MEKVDLVIFDMDGLILDTERMYLEFGLEVAEKMGFPVTEEEFISTVGLNDKSCAEFYKERYGSKFDFYEMMVLVDKMLLDASHNKEVILKDGIHELLDFLDEKSIKKVVATSCARGKAEVLLKNAGLLDRFDTLVCGDEVENGKPDPEIFLKAADKAGAVYENVIVLEDSINGLRGARSANMKPVMIPDLIPANDEIRKIIYAEVKSLDEVIGLL